MTGVQTCALPISAKEKPQEGKVLAVGPGRVDDSGKRIPVDVAEGDVVIYSKYGGTEIKYDRRLPGQQHRTATVQFYRHRPVLHAGRG